MVWNTVHPPVSVLLPADVAQVVPIVAVQLVLDHPALHSELGQVVVVFTPLEQLVVLLAVDPFPVQCELVTRDCTTKYNQLSPTEKPISQLSSYKI